MKKRWKARRDHGKLVMDNPEGFQKYIETLPEEIAVTVERWHRRTSNPQMAYYYGAVVRPLCDHTGFTVNEMDFVLKNMFLAEFVEINDYVIRKPISKTQVSTSRFEIFLQDCRQWAQSVLDVSLPLPNEVNLQERICTST